MSDINNTFDNNDQQINEGQQNPNYSYGNQQPNNQQTNYQQPNNQYSYGNGNQPSWEQNYGSGKGQGTGLGIASMVCGILSIVLICSTYVGLPILTYAAPVCGIVAIVLGIVQIVKNESKGMAIAGIVCGAVGVLIFVALILIGLWAINSGYYDRILNQYYSGV